MESTIGGSNVSDQRRDVNKASILSANLTGLGLMAIMDEPTEYSQERAVIHAKENPKYKFEREEELFYPKFNYYYKGRKNEIDFAKYKPEFSYYSTYDRIAKPKMYLKYYVSFGADSTESGQNLLLFDQSSLISFNKCHVWKYDKQRKRQTAFRAHKAEICAIAKHPYDDLVATADTSSTILVWDFRSFNIFSKIECGVGNGSLCMTFNTKGNNIASIFFDTTFLLGLFDAYRGTVLCFTRIGDGPIRSLQFIKATD